MSEVSRYDIAPEHVRKSTFLKPTTKEPVTTNDTVVERIVALANDEEYQKKARVVYKRWWMANNISNPSHETSMKNSDSTRVAFHRWVEENPLAAGLTTNQKAAALSVVNTFIEKKLNEEILEHITPDREGYINLKGVNLEEVWEKIFEEDAHSTT